MSLQHCNIYFSFPGKHLQNYLIFYHFNPKPALQDKCYPRTNFNKNKFDSYFMPIIAFFFVKWIHPVFNK